MSGQIQYEDFVTRLFMGVIAVISFLMLYVLISEYSGSNVRSLTLPLLVLITSLSILSGYIWEDQKYSIYIIGVSVIVLLLLLTYITTQNPSWFVGVLMFALLIPYLLYRLVS